MKKIKTLFLSALLAGVLFTSATGSQTIQSTARTTFLPVPVLSYSCPYPHWVAAQAYLAGDKVRYDGNYFVAKWYTQGDTPVKNGGLSLPWKDLGTCP